MKSYPDYAVVAGTALLACAFYGACNPDLSNPDLKPARPTSPSAETASPCTVTFGDPTPDFEENTVTVAFRQQKLFYKNLGAPVDNTVIPFTQLQDPEQKEFLRQAAQDHNVPKHCLTGTGL